MHKIAIVTAFLLTAAACTQEDRIELTCADYCNQLATCDDETDTAACRNTCEDAFADCQDDEVEQVIDEMNECANESCDDIGTCTLGAGLECFLGI